jgi:hypothetical protein
MSHIRRIPIALSLTLLALFFVAAAPTPASDDLWLHVSVQEGDSTSVNVNLPLRMIEKAIPLIPQDEIHVHHGGIHVDGLDMSLDDMREMMAELRNSPDMTFVSVEEEDESVTVSKSGDFLLVKVDDRAGGERVDVRMPLDVVDALLAGDGEELRIEDAIRALAAYGGGDIVTVEGDNEKVRVWIDGTAAGS